MNGIAQRAGDLPLRRTRTLGRFRLHALEAGLQRLDGGAMFGVVPKPLWERRIPPDERNRIPLALRCLLVETADALVLIDTGVGNKESAKFSDIYGVDNAGSAGLPTRLEEALRDGGFAPDDVAVMIDTHFHFDHAGGNTFVDEEGQIHLSFPRATYHVQRREWEFAHLRNERIQASYFPHNFDPVAEAGRFEFVEGERELMPGVLLLPTPGHTPGHQSILLESEGQVACYLADLVPTTAHLPLPWIMGYDVEPLVTLEAKRSLLARAEAECWLLIFEHDPRVPWGYLARGEERPRLVEEP
ncbi:MAG: MBL fold metallo-hydrolase [Gemmatimonadetes bacterium]|nr:MBL fold metallo-hydrolase [Gemmatimonadota bacterium]